MSGLLDARGPSQAIRWMLGGFALTLVLIVTIAVVALRLIAQQADLADRIYRHPLTVSNAVLEANAAILAMHRHMKDVVLANSPQELDASVHAVATFERQVHQRFDIIADRFLGDRLKIQRARQAFEDWAPIRAKVIALARRGDREAAAGITKGGGASHVILMTTRLNALTEFARGKAREFLAQSRDNEARSRILLIGLTAALVALGLAIAGLVIARVRRSERQMQAHGRRIALLLASAAEAIYGLDLDGRCTFANPACVRMLGYDAEADLIGRDMHGLLHPEARDGSCARGDDCPLAAVRDAAGPLHSDDLELWRRDDGCFPADFYAHPIIEEGARVGAVCTFLDVTERRQAEREVARKTDLLESSNEELQRFAYAASHDLQEPLRAIISYLQLLELRYAEQLGGDAREFIGFAVDGARRMTKLIRDILEYSRVETQGRIFATASPEQCLDAALKDLKPLIDDTAARVTVESLPAVVGDASQITRLFQNLIGNAIKYRRTDRDPEIRVRAWPDQGMIAFAVQDNGVGIDPRDQDRIFVVFKRLHDDRNLDGTGIGLAVCKRIVERHGGRIWVESTPGAGSTFLFTLPAA